MIDVDPRTVLELIATGRAIRTAIEFTVDDRPAHHDDRPARRFLSALARLDRAAIHYMADAIHEPDEPQPPLF